jgi:glycosyltransferase involved in cell wall biosynthesis
MKFSVLMSVYGREKPEYLSAALSSVFAQTLKAAQVVLVKDGPLTKELDETIEVFAARYDTLHVVVLPKNVGLGAALNAGLDSCEHDLVARMDTDDIAEPFRFERQIQQFLNNPKLSLVGSSVAEFENDPCNIERTRVVPTDHAEILRQFGQRCPINHPTVMFRKTAVLNAGGYNAEFMQEDYYLWGRMLAKGYIFENLDISLVRMRCGAGLYGRRGGIKYAISEVRLQMRFFKLGLVSYPQFLVNASARFIVRIMSERLRRYVYLNFLRGDVVNSATQT